jgi:small-conductance mechanosensitive channel
MGPNSPIFRLEQALDTYLGIAPAVAEGVLQTVVVLIAYFVVRRVARRVMLRTLEDPSQRYQVSRAVAYGFGILALLAVARIWIQGVSGLATYLGLASAGLAIALQDMLTNLAGWLFILVRQPFKVGDRIEIGPHRGDVVDIRLFRFIILEIGGWVHAEQATGRILHVPNGWVFKNAVANYDQAFGYVWNELEVTVTFESNWRRAKDALVKTVSEHAETLSPDAAQRIAEAANTFHIRFGKTTPVVWTSVVDNGVLLTARYLCKPRERRSSASVIWESVLAEVAAMADVDLAYSTVRYFDGTGEGKPALRGRRSP